MKLYLMMLLSFSVLSTTQAIAGSDTLSLQDVDTNRDGVMSPEESKRYLDNLALQHQRELKAKKDEAERLRAEQNAPEPVLELHPADLNKDGSVTPQELAAYKAALAKQTATAKKPLPKADDKNLSAYQKKRYGWREGEMNALDKNQDGVLQESELKAGSATKFNAADTNKDGVLSPEETVASLKAFENQKTKSDDTITGKQQANRLKNRLKNADADKNGKVSKSEYEAFMSKHQQNFDQNGDGIISKDEYRSDGERIPSKYMKKKTD